jgi:DNA-binding phage protein
MAYEIVRNVELQNSLDQARKDVQYHVAYAQETYSDELWQAMEHRSLSQVDFAKKANVSKQFLTKVFHGGNCTIETMVRLAFALNYKVNIHLTPNEVGCGWMHCVNMAALDSTPRPPERFIKLWTESGYQPVAIPTKKLNRDTVAFTS